MNFEEWFNIQDKSHKSVFGFYYINNDKKKMERGWKACKEEILEIIYQYQDEYTSKEMMEKIYNL